MVNWHDLRGDSRGLFESTFLEFLGGTEENR